jgi:C1A family cysteine protease
MFVTKAYEMDYSAQQTAILDSFMDKTPKELFKVWHLVFKKGYTFDSDEAKDRFKTFKQNLEFIKKTNADESLTYKLGLNQFSDMTNEEFKSKYATYKSLGSELQQVLDKANKDAGFLKPEPSEDDDDLTKRNLQTTAINYSAYFLTPKNQASCGGCWSFAVSGAVEGNSAMKTGYKVSGSPQQLLDCDSANYGCNGGDMRTGYNYLITYGMMNDSDYPFIGYQSYCRYNSYKSLVKVSGYQYCSNATSYKCSTATVYSLLQKGSLSVTIDGGSYLFQTYKSGLFNGACSTINHAVVLVGYGVSGAYKYWLIRNSWGTTWGENGYIRVIVNPSNNNSCFIENEAVLPIIQ